MTTGFILNALQISLGLYLGPTGPTHTILVYEHTIHQGREPFAVTKTTAIIYPFLLSETVAVTDSRTRKATSTTLAEYTRLAKGLQLSNSAHPSPNPHSEPRLIDAQADNEHKGLVASRLTTAVG